MLLLKCSFGYSLKERDKILKDVKRQMQVSTIVGPSGTGKIASLLLRFTILIQVRY
jgi:ABC-type multidrug transport system fused ATPase/permease subunit